jgi:hypothetical protein
LLRGKSWRLRGAETNQENFKAKGTDG